jgi:hypothetical protein
VYEIVQVELQEKMNFPADAGLLGDKILATALMFGDTIKGRA